MEKALEYMLSALEITKEVNCTSELISVLNNLGDIYLQMNDFKKAIKYLDEGLFLANDNNEKERVQENYHTRYEMFKRFGHLEKALESHEKYLEIKEELNNEEKMRQIAEIRTKYESEKKEKEAEIYRLKSVELAEANEKLQEAFDRIKVLKGLIPICAQCKKVRDDKGFWSQVEEYFSQHSDVEFSHGLCPECLSGFYDDNIENKVEDWK